MRFPPIRWEVRPSGTFALREVSLRIIRHSRHVRVPRTLDRPPKIASPIDLHGPGKLEDGIVKPAMEAHVANAVASQDLRRG